MKFVRQCSYPPRNGASLGSYLSKNGCFWAYFASPEIIEVKICDRRTDRQILWQLFRGSVDFLFKLNFLPPYLLRWQGDNFEQSFLFSNSVILKLALTSPIFSFQILCQFHCPVPVLRGPVQDLRPVCRNWPHQAPLQMWL